MRALFDFDLPNVFRGWFMPIERIQYDREKPYHEYFPSSGIGPIRLRKKGPAGTQYENSRLAASVRDTGGVLVMPSNNSSRIYARASQCAMIIPRGHEAARNILELKRAYLFHYEISPFVPPAFMEVAIQCFGEPKDRRRNQYILSDPEAFAEYEEIFHRYP